MIDRIFHLTKSSIIDERLTIVFNQFPIFANIDWETYDNMPNGTKFTLIVNCRVEDLKSIDQLLEGV